MLCYFIFLFIFSIYIWAHMCLCIFFHFCIYVFRNLYSLLLNGHVVLLFSFVHSITSDTRSVTCPFTHSLCPTWLSPRALHLYLIIAPSSSAFELSSLPLSAHLVLSVGGKQMFLFPRNTSLPHFFWSCIINLCFCPGMNNNNNH